jgi:hypothetical protein
MLCPTQLDLVTRTRRRCAHDRHDYRVEVWWCHVWEPLSKPGTLEISTKGLCRTVGFVRRVTPAEPSA